MKKQADHEGYFYRPLQAPALVGVFGKERPNRCIALIYACDISSWIFTQSIPILGLQGTGGDWVELKAVDAGAVSLQPVPHTGPDSAWGMLNTKPVPAQ